MEEDRRLYSDFEANNAPVSQAQFKSENLEDLKSEEQFKSEEERWEEELQNEEEEAAQRARTLRLKDNLSLLQEWKPKLLAGLEDCRLNREPMTLHVEGYEHNADIILALIQCAHVYGVSLTLVPFPTRILHDTANGQG